MSTQSTLAMDRMGKKNLNGMHSSKPKVWITGADGFLGRNVTTHLQSNGYETSELVMTLPNWESIQRAVEKIATDTSSQGDGKSAARKQSQVLIHFAGLSHVPTCEKNPELAYSVNALGTVLLLEAIRKSEMPLRFIFASTAQVYAKGEEGGDWVFTEESPISPQNLYARTKLLAESALSEATLSSSIQGEILRIFNHTHRTQSPDFFLPHLHQELLKSKELGGGRAIPVGNLDLARDLGCVQDFCRAIEAILAHQPKPGAVPGVQAKSSIPVWNIASGTAKNLRMLAEEMAKRIGCQPNFEVDSSRLRKGEPIRIVGSHDRLTRATGWVPHAKSEADLIESFLAG
jgi:GDP-4-dehydro-6-deoxy-D-mannose reductase